MPGAVFVPAELNDLSVDVSVGTPAQGAVFYRGPSKWNALAAGTSGQFLKSQGAAANPIWDTVAAGATTLDGLTDVNLPTASQGDILYRNATEWVRLVAGTSGQVLTTAGAAANPAWQTVASADLTPAVILAPTTGTRNDIQPTADVTPLRVLARVAGQTANLTSWLNTAGAIQGRITSAGLFSCPGAGADSERFGIGTLAAGANATALGGIATAAGAMALAVGYGAVASGFGGIGIGPNAASTGSNSYALGQSAVSSLGGISLGVQANANGGNLSSVALGHTAIATGAGQCVIGGASPFGINTYYLGNGITAAAPGATTLQPSGGSGTDIAGANITFAGGKGTGDAKGGDQIFSSTRSGQGSATTLRTLEEIMRLSNAGVLTFTQRSSTADRSAFDITPTWATATDASRKARAVFNIWDTAVREAMRFEASGTAPMVGFLGAAAVVRPAVYTLTGSATRTLPTDPSGAYTGIDNLQVGTVYATVADLNTLRAAVSSLLGVTRQLITDFSAAGGGNGLLT